MKRIGSLLLLVLALAILGGSVQSIQAASPSDAAGEAARLVERVAEYSAAHPGDPGTVAQWSGTTIAAPLEIWAYRAAQPSSFLVPVIASSGELAGYVGIDQESAAWRWYVATLPGSRPLTTEDQARAIMRTMDATPTEAALAQAKLVQMPDRHLYWYASWNDASGIEREIFLDASDSSRLFYESDRDDAGLTRAQIEALAPEAEQDAADAEQDAVAAKQDAAAAGEAAQPSPLRYPPEYNLVVPYYQQVTDYNCGPAALCMVFDYSEMPIPQSEVAQAANCLPGVGSYANDIRRAGHFSNLSTSVQNPNLHGYTRRSYGYASMDVSWSYGSNYTTRYSDLKELVSNNVPILILTWYAEDHSSGHFRVVKGYSDPLNVFIVHDPWYTPPYHGPDVNFRQDFLVDDLWVYSGRWGMTSQPWAFTMNVPGTVHAGETFTAGATIAYPGMHPLEAQYTAASPQATIQLAAGLSLAPGETATKALPGIQGSGSSATVAWNLIAAEGTGTASLTINAGGTVTGSSHSYSYYQDYIGGVITRQVVIETDPASLASEESADVPLLAFESCGPNPFRDGTALRFRLARSEPVRLSIHDAGGRLVGVLLDGQLQAGTYSLAWPGRDAAGAPVAPGLYFARLRAGTNAEDRRLVLLR